MENYLLLAMCVLCGVSTGFCNNAVGTNPKRLPLISCNIDELPSNGYVTRMDGTAVHEIGDTVPFAARIQYGCHGNYTLKGHKINHCLGTRWRYPVAQCQRLCSEKVISSLTFTAKCMVPSAKGMQIVRCAQPAEPGTIARLNCRDGYESDGYESDGYESDTLPDVTCNEHGHWSPRPITCKPICGRTGPQGSPFIIGGQLTNITAVPWQMAIYMQTSKFEYELKCSATILNARIGISAMHCLWDVANKRPYDASLFRVVVGKTFRDYRAIEYLPTQSFGISRVHFKREYEDYAGLYANDLAVFVLDRFIEFKPHVVPVCMDYDMTAVEAQNQLNGKKRGRVAGWGLQSTSDVPSPVLKVIDLPAIGREECLSRSKQEFRSFVTADKFCAGALNSGVNVCKGDSGGGMVFSRDVDGEQRFFLRGIVSVGGSKNGGCDVDNYVAYTDVHQFNDFIRKLEESHRPQIQSPSMSADKAGNDAMQACVVRALPSNGYAIDFTSRRHVYAIGDRVAMNTQIEYACHENYALADSRSRLNVCINGEWINEVPQCQTIAAAMRLPGFSEPCTVLEVPRNGWIESGRPPHARLIVGDPVRSGADIIYRCNGDNAYGDLQPECRNCVWSMSTVPECKARCSLSTVNIARSAIVKCTVNGVEVPCTPFVPPGTVVETKCQPQYEGQDEALNKIQCKDDGKWDGQLHRCLNLPFEGKGDREPVPFAASAPWLLTAYSSSPSDVINTEPMRYGYHQIGTVVGRKFVVIHRWRFGDEQSTIASA